MSASEPTVALVFSPERWVEELHRHLSHHGGARVRQVVVEPAVALDEDYDALVVSDRWPSLTYGFVRAVHERGRRILGVFDPAEPAGNDHLRRLGVDAAIAADVDPHEFVAALHDLRPTASDVETRIPAAMPLDDAGVGRGTVVGVCGPRGSGVTEVALGVAVALVERGRSVVLLDGHETAPAVAGRLGLALEPNLRTAVDASSHGLGCFDDCLVAVHVGRRVLHVIAGHPSAVAASQVSTQDVLDVVADARRTREYVVVDLDERTATTRALLEGCDAVIGVVAASPVGIVRGVEWLGGALGRTPKPPLHLVVNRAPRRGFRQHEVRAELLRNVRPASLAWCPHDRAVEVAAWDGDPVGRGPFRSACAGVASVLAASVPASSSGSGGTTR